MKIRNTEGLSARALQREVEKGARFVHYTYTFSYIIYTVKKDSPVYMIRSGESNSGKKTLFTFISVLFGWWGIPNGPRLTLESIRTNMKGGKDVTDEVMATVAGHILFQETQKQQKARAV